MKTLGIALASLVLSAGMAAADTVNFSFAGTSNISTSLNNLSCNLTGSGAGVVPTGCNYAIGVDSGAGTWSVTLTSGNAVCTQSISSSDSGADKVCQFK